MPDGTWYQYKFDGKVGTDTCTDTDSMVRLESGTDGLKFPMARLKLGKMYQYCFGIGYKMPRSSLIVVNLEPDTNLMVRFAALTNIKSMVTLSLGTNDLRFSMARLESSKIVSVL